MADTPLHRGGRYAVYQGHAYWAIGDSTSPMITLCVHEGDPVPEGLAANRQGPADSYLVDPRNVTAWYTSSWTFRWKGEEFASYGSRNGRITGYYQGSQGSPFAEVHLTRVGAIEYEGTFPLEEVTDLTETRLDLLASWKEKHPE
ncbi:hypothetical protein ACEZDB_01665 [Streptacidiphilus sp. N1-3]|uniref:Uncharacterized protein n=1 Tax=Streptacidiphilus alkalitolerans TaxID=3342712 RepID=A0ABV6WTK0_9ACTN